MLYKSIICYRKEQSFDFRFEISDLRFGGILVDESQPRTKKKLYPADEQAHSSHDRITK